MFAARFFFVSLCATRAGQNHWPQKAAHNDTLKKCRKLDPVHLIFLTEPAS